MDRKFKGSDEVVIKRFSPTKKETELYGEIHIHNLLLKKKVE